MLITGGSGSGKTNTLLNLIKEQDSNSIVATFIRMLKTQVSQDSFELHISLAFITKSYFSVSKEVRLNSTHYLMMKI